MEIPAQLAQATRLTLTFGAEITWGTDHANGLGGGGVLDPSYWVQADFKEYESFHGKINGYENNQFQQYTF